MIGFCAVDVDPISEMKLLRLWIVVAGHLFRQQTNDQRPELKIRGRQSEFLQSHFGGVHLSGLRVAIQVAQDHLFDLRAGLCRTLHRPQNGELPNLACFFQDLFGGRRQRRVSSSRSACVSTASRPLRRYRQKHRTPDRANTEENN